MISSVSCIGDLEVAQHTERGAAGSEVHNRDVVLDATVGHLVSQQQTRVFQCERFDIHHFRGQPGSLDGRLTLLDILGATGHQQYIAGVRVLDRGSDYLEIVADLFHRKRYVLVGLEFDLTFEFRFGKAGRELDYLCNRSIHADGDRCLAAFRTGAFDCPADRFTNGFSIDDCLLVHRVRRSRFR
mgnify:FL=1